MQIVIDVPSSGRMSEARRDVLRAAADILPELPLALGVRERPVLRRAQFLIAALSPCQDLP